ncbi:hypothetical protein KIW84_034352 [Lathyrus oleraceus]|uniref:Uncharacterized protein n=1 Tax=Pisum sativum TaxID=3888 RepID=A0A9D4Y386_PEA|nr:hypothetical protein KIW84_034352 [Pisum sativum]
MLNPATRVDEEGWMRIQINKLPNHTRWDNEVVIPCKRYKRGLLYTFVRFFNVKDDDFLATKLHNIFLYGRKLHENVPRGNKSLGEYVCSDDASRLRSKLGFARILVKAIQFKLLKEVLEVMNNGSPLKVKIIEDSQGPMRLVEALDS